jgi:hypothetical protein
VRLHVNLGSAERGAARRAHAASLLVHAFHNIIVP